MSSVQDTSWKETFPPFLRDAMRTIGMDPDTRGAIADFARATGLPASTVSRWLAGSVQPTVPNLRDIAPVLKIRIITLLVAAGHLDPAEAATAEEHIAQTPGLSSRQVGELLGYLGRMRERTGYYDRHGDVSGDDDDASDSIPEAGDDERDETG